MDFLRAAAKCLFYDYSLEYVADCTCPNKKGKGKRNKHLLDRLRDQLVWRERNYSRENINSVTDFIVNEWMGGGTLKGESMNREKIYERLNEVFRDVFDRDDITVSDETTAADVEGWDSLIHITLMDAVEEEFDIRFDMKTVVKMKNVGELVDAIERLI